MLFRRLFLPMISVALFAAAVFAGYKGTEIKKDTPQPVPEKTVTQEVVQTPVPEVPPVVEEVSLPAAPPVTFVPASVPQPLVNAMAASFPGMKEASLHAKLPEGSFLGPDGQRHRFKDFEGMPVLVNFWATWCGPCVIELPFLDRLAKRYEGRMKVIALSIEQERDIPYIRNFLDRRQLGDFALYLDFEGNIGQKLSIPSLPTTFLLGKDGRILYIFEGEGPWASPESYAFFDSFISHNN